MNLVYGPPVVDFVQANIPNCDRGFGECSSLGVEVDGEVVGGTVFHNYDPRAGTIEVSGAGSSPKWMSRAYLNEIMGYVFNELLVQMVVARSDHENTKAAKFWETLGASKYEIPRLAGRNQSQIIFTFTDDQWKESRFNNG